MCESQRSDFFAACQGAGLRSWALWPLMALPLPSLPIERPRAEPLWSSDAAALAAVDIPVTAEFASALTAASSMGALAAVAGASPAVSAANTWLAWAELSAGVGVSFLVAPVAAAADSVAAMHSTCGSVVPSPLLTTGVGAAVLSIGGWASVLLTTGVGTAGLSIGGLASPLLSVGVGPAVLSRRGTSSRANSYAALFTMVRQRFAELLGLCNSMRPISRERFPSIAISAAGKQQWTPFHLKIPSKRNWLPLHLYIHYFAINPEYTPLTMRPTASTPPHWPDPWTFVQLKGMDQNSCRRPLSQLSNQSLFEVRPRFPQPVSQCSCRCHVAFEQSSVAFEQQPRTEGACPAEWSAVGSAANLFLLAEKNPPTKKNRPEKDYRSMHKGRICVLHPGFYFFLPVITHTAHHQYEFVSGWSPQRTVFLGHRHHQATYSAGFDISKGGGKYPLIYTCLGHPWQRTAHAAIVLDQILI